MVKSILVKKNSPAVFLEQEKIKNEKKVLRFFKFFFKVTLFYL